MGKISLSASDAEKTRRHRESFEDYLKTVRAEFEINSRRYLRQLKQDLDKMLVDLKQDLQKQVDGIRVPPCDIPGCSKLVKKRFSFVTERGIETMHEMLVCEDHCESLKQQCVDSKQDWKESDYGG